MQELDSVDLRRDPDPLRPVLTAMTGLAFAPGHYKVWRNYARVFKVLGLASSIGDRLATTQLCGRLLMKGQDFLPYDDFLHHVVRTFCCPSPAFDNYDPKAEQIFPFCAILKLLLQKPGSPQEVFTDMQEVTRKLIANGVTGREPITRYGQLAAKDVSIPESQFRQVREMIIFLSQLSYLSWMDGKLYMDKSALSDLSLTDMEALATPIVRERLDDPDMEIQALSHVMDSPAPAAYFREPAAIEDSLFAEGKRIRVSHLRTERNRKVVAHYFSNCSNQYLCDLCQTEVKARYPWVSNLIEVHHVLPLASPLQVALEGTSIADLVGLCPNCHRATHAYYRFYLADRAQEDFSSREEAHEVYAQARAAFVRI